MPVGACDSCSHRFVIEDARSPQRTCPRCLHPMRLVDSKEALTHLHASENGRRPPIPAPGRDVRCLCGTPLASTEIGRQVLEALAKAAAIQSEAIACRLEAQELRERVTQTRHALKSAREALRRKG